MNPKAVDCPFCDYLLQDPTKDPENLILLRAPRSFIILNRYPYNNGHLMILPNIHVADLEALDEATQLEMIKLAAYSKIMIDKALQPHGFNLGLNLGKAAGAGLAAHLHIHVVPRWYGDTNFMPIVAETRVLPEWLAETYQRLRAVIAMMPFA